MKLYTEEQIKDAYYKGFYTDYRAIPYSDSLGLRQTPDSYCREFVKSLTPIELPSDDEIIEKLKNIRDNEHKLGYSRGTQWVINYIKQQDGRE
jgi:hypothetical protein